MNDEGFTRGPRYPCAHCGKFLDGHVGPRELRPGDFCVCAYCASVLEFFNDGYRVVEDLGRLDPMVRAEVERAVGRVKELRKTVERK